MLIRITLIWILTVMPVGVFAQFLRSDETVESFRPSIEADGGISRREHRGSNNVIIYDLDTKTQTQRVLFGSDEISLPNFINDPANEIRIDIPVQPADLRFAMIEIDNAGGGGSCTATYIGKRHFLTSGHCVYANGWPTSGRVVPGFDDGRTPIGVFAMRRIITFTGWVQTGDKAHDVAVIEVNRELPGNVRPVPVRWQPIVCRAEAWQLLSFQRNFYIGGAGKQMNYQIRHRGCEEGTLYFFTNTPGGSSGSAAIAPQGYAYGVYHGWRGNRGYDAPITRAKECFIREMLLGEAC